MFSLRKLWVVAAVLAVAGLVMVLGSCSTAPDGDVPENFAPIVKIVNIPAAGSHFTTSPLINWYGTDADGYIIAYEYAIVRASVVAAAVDTSNEAAVREYARTQIDMPGPASPCDPTCWIIINVATTDSPTRQQIRLIAGNTPEDTVVQFFFVRAVDNDSTRSIIEYSVYSRNNHPPTTEIVTVPDTLFYYDLPETTLTYNGITMEWKGLDKLDFPNEADQPEFTFYYQIFGPYPHGQLDYDPETGVPGGAFVIDTTDITKLVLTSRDATLGGVWVKATTGRFYNLWRNQAVSDTSRMGDFVLKVVARDDASAPDPTPEYRVFTAIDFKPHKRVLIFVPSFCASGPTPGEVPCFPEGAYTNLPYDIYGEDDMVEAYQRIFSQAGYPDAELVRVPRTGLTRGLSKEVYARYRVVAMLNDGSQSRMSSLYIPNLLRYMDFGGNVWLWAPAIFGGSAETLNGFQANSWQYRYFNVTGEFRSFWTPSYTKKSTWPPDRTDSIPMTNEQFTGGLALNGTEFSDFKIDLERAQLSYNFLRTSVRAQDTLRFRGAPNTSYFIRDIFSQPLFLFESYFGNSVPDSARAYIRPMQGTIVAVRQSNGVWKSAVFGFSAFCTREDQAIDITRKMMAWFLR